MAPTAEHEIVSEEARTLARKAMQKPSWRISADTWAVALALVLTTLVWSGWIKRIPW